MLYVVAIRVSGGLYKFHEVNDIDPRRQKDRGKYSQGITAYLSGLKTTKDGSDYLHKYEH